jgi:hypothetical protein
MLQTVRSKRRFQLTVKSQFPLDGREVSLPLRVKSFQTSSLGLSIIFRNSKITDSERTPLLVGRAKTPLENSIQRREYSSDNRAPARSLGTNPFTTELNQ